MSKAGTRASRAPACGGCGTTSREVQWSVLLKAHVCLACYLPHAPDVPEDWEPYRPPKPPRPPAREVASRRIYAAMVKVAPAAWSKAGIVGTCPLCRAVLRASIGREATVLECDSGCAEDTIWRELRL